MSINITGGSWQGSEYLVHSDDSDTIVYKRNGAYTIKYVRSTLTWQDAGNDLPTSLNSGSIHVSGQTSVYNPVNLYGFTDTGSLRFSFVNPHYVTPPTPTGTEGFFSCQLEYVAATNVMHYFMNATEPSTDMISTRNLHYRVRNATIDNVSTDVNFNHYNGTHTNGYFNPTVAGTYQLEKVLTNPLEVLICDSASVTQSNIDAYNASNTPPNTPRGRRGNLNFW